MGIEEREPALEATFYVISLFLPSVVLATGALSFAVGS